MLRSTIRTLETTQGGTITASPEAVRLFKGLKGTPRKSAHVETSQDEKEGRQKAAVSTLRRMRDAEYSSRTELVSHMMLTSSDPLQGVRDDTVGPVPFNGRKPFCPSHTTGKSSWQTNPTFSFCSAFLPSSHLPRELVHGAHPYTQNFSEAMENICDDKNMKIKILSKEEDLKRAKLSTYNAAICKELVCDGLHAKAAFDREMSGHWSVRKEEDKRMRVREVEAGLQMTQSAKETTMTQRQQIYQEEQERRRVDLHEKMAKMLSQQSAKFETQYSLMKSEYADLVQGHIDPKLQKYEKLGAQQKKDTYSCYKLEMFDKMQVLTLLA